MAASSSLRSSSAAAAETTTMERDDDESEHIPRLECLLLPDGKFPVHVKSFGVSYSQACFGGWVKQGSPCCAAASVAGAWNALFDLTRSSPSSLNQKTILEVKIIPLFMFLF